MVPDHADQARRLIVGSVSLREIRSYERLDLDLGPGLVLVIGPNGAGKTNLLEAVHLGAQGFSPRTRTDGEIVRFGASGGRVALEGKRGTARLAIEVTLRAGEPKRASLNGAPLRVAEQLRSEVAALVFTPDRLAVVKGGPAVRRAYFDRALGRFWPARSALSPEYAAAVGQRNAALRRVAAGFAPRDALDPWTDRIVELGAQLTAARRELLTALTGPFAVVADELGLPDAELRYEGVEPTHEALEARLQRDLDRGTTGAGPHLEDVGIAARGLELRSFGSQGEQRLGVLSLLLGEAELLTASRGTPPLLLLDDVLSELDADRRRILARRISGRGQALVTATAQEALPAAADTLVEVASGTARRVA